MFSFNESSFVIQKCKETTGRVVVFREYNVLNSFTLECSFCGPNQGMRKDTHFNPGHLLVSALLF